MTLGVRDRMQSSVQRGKAEALNGVFDHRPFGG
ncbi:MAG: hypothetical protein HW378_3110 [Anaerolineales bacterium]|nr:hypothetical protein [Anaerolineales bacterium]